jgi:soluble lytic murein transglycosylase-like protein
MRRGCGRGENFRSCVSWVEMRSFLNRRPIYSRLIFAIFTLALASLPCLAGDVAVLHNGFSIRHERREVIGAITRLYVNADGSSYVDVATADIDHFEEAPAVASPNLNTQPASLKVNETPAQAAASQQDLNSIISSASEEYRLDPDLVASVIKAESGFNVHAVSPKGARGLMQLMPQTANGLGVPNAFDAHANVEGGTKYLRELLERYNFDLVKALAAYNAGPQRVEQYGGVPPYHETRAYVARIVRDFNKKKTAQETASTSQKKQTTNKTASKQNTASPKKSSHKTQTASGKPQSPAPQVQASAKNSSN